MDDLVTFLRAQLDDDERVARQVTAEPGGFYIEAETPDVNIMTVGAHVFRWTPKRVLAEVGANRRIIDECIRTLEVEDHGYVLAEFVIRSMALPFADRPGYLQEWRP